MNNEIDGTVDGDINASVKIYEIDEVESKEIPKRIKAI
jgi:hypothetical protein